MFHFLETDIREQKKYEKTIKASVDNTVNDLCYEIKFENRVKDKTKVTFYSVKLCFSFFKKNIFHSCIYFFLFFVFVFVLAR